MEIQKKEKKEERNNPEGEKIEVSSPDPDESGLAPRGDIGKESSGKKEQKTKKAKKPDTVTISIDNTPEEVVQLNNDGVKLLFDHANGRFLKLPPEVARDLSYENKQRYFVSKGMFEETLSFDHYDRRKFPPKAGFATATDRLDVKNKDPRMHYCWKRPDELRQAQLDGYRPAADDTLDTFSNPTGSTRTVGTGGQEELILMEVPKEVKEQQRAANKEKDHRRREGVESSAVDDMIRGGGKPFIPKEGD